LGKPRASCFWVHGRKQAGLSQGRGGWTTPNCGQVLSVLAGASLLGVIEDTERATLTMEVELPVNPDSDELVPHQLVFDDVHSYQVLGAGRKAGIMPKLAPPLSLGDGNRRRNKVHPCKIPCTNALHG